MTVLTEEYIQEKIKSEQKLREQQKDITESLQYASYIQSALLPNENQIQRAFKEYFIFYLPRDIVSGDFYWIIKRRGEIFVAIADCTGHGVPGAFMSILGITGLNQIVDRGQYTTAASILNRLREFVMKALQQRGNEKEQKDGIDLALCKIDTCSHTLEYAGAFNPMYLLRKGTLTEFEPDKMPIGIAAEYEEPFTNHEVKLEEDDLIYLFSDGFVDQFGGSQGKKFKYRPFRSLLVSLANKPMDQQCSRLKEIYLSWKSGLPQLDDILIFGFKYHKENTEFM